MRTTYLRLRKRIDHTVPGAIVGAWAAGLVVAVGNHLFFRWLNEQRPSFNDHVGELRVSISPKLESAIANAFADVVKTLLGFSLATSLIQVMWRIAHTHRVTVAQLDSIFGLPSLAGMVRLTLHSTRSSFLSLFALGLVGYGLLAVTIVVPGSLVIWQSLGTPRRIPVSFVDLFSPPGDNAVIGGSYNGTGWVTEPGFSLDSDVFNAMIRNSTPTWASPPECGASCSYSMMYFAPALDCTLLDASAIADQTEADPNSFPAQLSNWTLPWGDCVYNATSNLPQVQSGLSYDVWGYWNLTIAFLPPDDVPQGASCIFYNATYKVDTAFTQSIQSTNVSILERHQNLKDIWVDPTNDCPLSYDNDIGPAPCLSAAVNARVIVMAFVARLRGTVQWHFPDDTAITATDMLPLFTVDFNNSTISLDNPSVPLDRLLEELMANTTLASVWRYNVTTEVDALVDISLPLYHYDPIRLWAAYGSAIFVTALSGIYGLWCLHANGSPGSIEFSRLAAVAQSPGLESLTINQDAKTVTDEQKQIMVEFGEIVAGDKIEDRILAFGVVGQDDIRPLPSVRKRRRRRSRRSVA